MNMKEKHQAKGFLFNIIKENNYRLNTALDSVLKKLYRGNFMACLGQCIMSCYVMSSLYCLGQCVEKISQATVMAFF